ncbi:MAG: UDP-diphosphatase [Verrucomicrobia bacterium]|nr:MAG: UDP-diphosphatase [Verrucomicrobiota bacterium]
MNPNLFQILILGLVQGAAELLPVSSSAHVIVVEKLMGLDPSAPELTFLLVMLHTGTMFAVICYFRKSWHQNFFSSWEKFRSAAIHVVVATFVTGILGLSLEFLIEKIFLRHHGTAAEVEMLFGQLPLIAIALSCAGLLIVCSGILNEKHPKQGSLSPGKSAWIGAMQGLCLPFRGFSRSGATISAGLLAGIERRRCEEFSFALVVVLTPPVIIKELWRLLKAHADTVHPHHLAKLLFPGVFGMACSFIGGLLALWLLSNWLERGRWKFFGYYCFAFALVVLAIAKLNF